MSPVRESAMSTDVVCSAFQQHAWKKELCANCLKARSLHVGVPVPAKRTSLSATSSQDVSGISGEMEEGKPTISGVGGKTRKLSGNNARGHSPGRHTTAENVERCNSTGEETKPAEVKLKPTIASKPSKLHKQASDEKLGAKDLSLKGSEEMDGIGETNIEANIPKQATTSGVVMRHSLEKSLTGRPDVAARTKKSKSSRPMSPPPSAPGKPEGQEPTYGENTAAQTRADAKSKNCAGDTARDSATDAETGKAHFYHEYDVSGRGTLPSSSSGVKRRKGVDTLPTQPYKVVDITGSAGPATVQPYTVVDVTSTPPLQPLDHPPKQPSSPAPDQENSGGSSCSHGSSYSGSSLGSRKSRTSSESSDKVASLRKTEPKREGMNASGSSVRERVGAMSPNMSVRSHKESEQLKEEGRSPKTARKVPIVTQRQLIQQHTYEEISRDGNSLQDQDDIGGTRDFMRQTSSRSSAMKSASFEAKVAALSNLNLSSYAKDGDKKQMENEYERKIPAKTPPMSRRLNCSLVASQDVKCVAKSPPATAKNKKGPTSFFKKLLKIGGRSSSGNELGGDSCRKIEEFDGRSFSFDSDAKDSDLDVSVVSGPEEKRDSLGRKTTLDHPGRSSLRKTSLPRLPDDLKQAIEKAAYLPKASEQQHTTNKVPSPRPRTDIASGQRQPPARQSSPSQKMEPKDVLEKSAEPEDESVYGTQKVAEKERSSYSSTIVPSAIPAESITEDIPCEDPVVEPEPFRIETTTEVTEDVTDGDSETFSDEGSVSRRESMEDDGKTTFEGAVKMRSKSESQAKAGWWSSLLFLPSFVRCNQIMICKYLNSDICIILGDIQ